MSLENEVEHIMHGWKMISYSNRMNSDHNVKVSEQIKTNVKVLFTECEVNESELEGINIYVKYKMQRTHSAILMTTSL